MIQQGFQPGTHVFLKPTPAAVVTPEVPFRSWLAFDNRVVHRGEANRILPYISASFNWEAETVHSKPWATTHHV